MAGRRWYQGPLVFGLLFGCELSGEVTVKGLVASSRDALELPLQGGQIELRDDSGSLYDSASIGADGEFSVRAPMGSDIFATVLGSEHIVASFTGVSGYAEVFQVEDGALFGVSQTEWTQWREQFAGCPGVDTGAGIIGEVRMSSLVDSETGEAPLVSTAQPLVEDLDGVVYTTCFLDEEGLLYDPAAEYTGASGVFAIFGLPEGFVVIDLKYQIVDDVFYLRSIPVWAPKEGVIPLFPAWVEFPFEQ
jgi:hypothetical protein